MWKKSGITLLPSLLSYFKCDSLVCEYNQYFKYFRIGAESFSRILGNIERSVKLG